jgi:tol-pal system protein YbgF
LEKLTNIMPLFLHLSVVVLMGCGGAETLVETTPTAEAPSAESQLRRLHEQNEQLASRVRELEGRLSLSRAEARELREAAVQREAAPEREIVRIGAHAPAAQLAQRDEGAWDEPQEEEAFGIAEDESDRSPRPVLRLYGSPAAAPIDTSTPLFIPPPPPGIPFGLPIADLPSPELAFAASAPDRTPMVRDSRAHRADQAAVAAYQAALTHLRDRHFDDALRAFDAFLNAHPRHPYAASAVYWQGEVYYAMRDYSRALARFSRVVDNYPSAAKVSDSLFKMGLCHKRMGRAGAARRIFERVRRQHPDSVAARLSVQEDAR